MRFPVAVDEAVPGSPIPKTMAAYGMQGTPTLLAFDRDGRLQADHFGHIDDLALGALLGAAARRGVITMAHQGSRTKK